MKTVQLCLCGLLMGLLSSAKGKENHKIAAYWGQNGVYNKHKENNYWEKDLGEFCKNYNYDTINIAFLNVFFSSANKGRFPGLNFANHCSKPVSADYPKLLKCPKIERGIKECQRRGKKVLLSLGGAVGDYGFKHELDALLLAYRIYHLFFDGEELIKLRPFGSAILDGVDLNIEKMDSSGNKYYTHFVKELRNLEKSGSKKLMITAAPQCPFPDRYLGPKENTVLGDVPELIDEIYIQFYNNWCQTGNSKSFTMRFRQWMGYSINNNGPLVYIGLPADEKASGNRNHYRKHHEIRKLYKKLKDTPKFGGFMIWDASFDQNSHLDKGMRYSEYLKKMMMEENKQRSTISPTNPATTIERTSTKMKSTVKPTENPKGSVSCHGNRFGLFSHPEMCTKFIHCSHFVPYVKDCPAGLYFNPSIKVCDWPRNVEC